MFLQHTITATASHTYTMPYKQLYMQACYAADIAQCSVAISLVPCNDELFLQEVLIDDRMDLYQKRNLTIRTYTHTSAQKLSQLVP